MAELMGGARERTRLRQLLAASEPVLAPGAYDALSARLIEQAGFRALFLTGFGASASLLGRPDIGLLSFSEMVDQARRMTAAVDLAVIADADNGYGGPINVIRTVREYEAAGVAAIQLEDQVLPKRCGHMEGKQVVPVDEMVNKLRAAVDARCSEECLIIARSDARAVEGLERTIDRGHRYREAGADILFIEAPQSEQEVGSIGRAFGASIPLLFNWVDGGKSPPLSREVLKSFGFRIIIFPVTLLFAVTQVIRERLGELLKNGAPLGLGEQPQPPQFAEFLDLIGMPEIRALEKRFAR